MNYSVNSKNRKLKYRLHLILNRISFNFLNLSWSEKITLIWAIISFFSLFAPWFTIESDKIIINNSFSINSWYIWYIIFCLIWILAFLILSNSNKEKFKSKTNLVFHDHTIIIFFWLMVFLLTLAIFNSIRWFTLYFQNITIWNWIVFELIWAIFISLWWILIYKEKKNELLNKIYIENSQLNGNIDLEEYKNIIESKPNVDKKNMSLPI
ncbi:MAG: hypothetical protein ACD_4C00441G0011 [uncultured bacterium (gcode 4)]|uniref:Transmembrane protein n=1 Tax=uncultured bacterium (gcode 4) TaxID=1234023 RepID=K2FT97_9BACT|nr:MAG: hypothetical protein ACD_4C00441G0011 [uncultured bacterium (gcode 4)]